MTRPPPSSPLFPYPTLSRSEFEVPADAYYGATTMRAVVNFPISDLRLGRRFIHAIGLIKQRPRRRSLMGKLTTARMVVAPRSEEHTSELQSHLNLVCRLLLE